ncbi:Oxidoreductase-like protein, N-terminal [Popillia japonica]|uniref:Oxidoreductase-like protein, N-terminal n=1 Tax=Popillia japonica TaxID=7064 RepID=A0AAW1ICX2_POPJA
MAITVLSTTTCRIHPRMVCTVFSRYYCSNTFENVSEEKTKVPKPVLKGIPEAPTTCCMTGCPNCVWLEYAEKLTEYFKDGGEKALKEIDTHVTDTNVKAYLMHELKMRNKS